MINKTTRYIALALGLSGFANVALANEMVNPEGNIVVGYWHNWCGTPGANGGKAPCVTLDEIDPSYNVVTIAFMQAENSTTDRIPTFKLDPTVMSEQEFIDQIDTLNKQGRAVILSLGGGNKQPKLIKGDETAFAEEIIRLTDKYGFDGLDIDLEADSITAANNRTVVPAALKIVKEHYKDQGKNFLITMAPEVPNLKEGGKYAPYVKALEGYYDWINPQFYGQGHWGIEVEDIGWVRQDDDAMKEEFIYYTSDSLANGTRGFLKIPHDSLIYGIPTNIDAAGNGFVKNPQDLMDAFNQLKAEGQPLRGVMAWSINWDMGKKASGRSYNNEFIDVYGPFIHGDTPPPPIDGKPIFHGIENTRVQQGKDFDPYQGITAVDKEDGNLTSSIVVEGTVDVNTIGSYVLIYSVKDSDNNETKETRIVYVYSLLPQLKGVDDTTIELGESFDPMEGVKAIDAEDGDLTDQIRVSGKVDTNVIDNYDLVYRVTDSANQTTTAHRVITVKSSGQCADPWDKNTVYVAGDLVSHKGATWKARYWTRGEEPGTTGEYGAWKKVDDQGCDPNSDFDFDVAGINDQYTLDNGSVELNVELSTSEASSVAITIDDSKNTAVYDNVQQVDGSTNIQIVFDNIEAGHFTFSAVATPEEGNSETISQSFSVVDSSGGEYLPYDPNTKYVEGDIIIGADDDLYQCKPWPYSGWCSNPAYAPGESAIWSEAWTKL